MNLQYSNKKDLAASCPNCSRPYLVLVTTLVGQRYKDFLACKICKFSILIEEYKKKLFSE
jgi:hypothetical protein